MNIPDCWVLYCQKSVMMMIGAVCVFFMIGGKLMRLSLMLVKSLVFNFLWERGCLLHPFSFLIRKKQRKDKIIVRIFAHIE